MITSAWRSLAMAAAALVSVAGVQAQAQTTAKATFALTSNTNVTTKASNIATATYASNTGGGGIIFPATAIGNDGFGNVLQVYANLGGTSELLSALNGSYISFSLTAATGQTLGINSLTYSVGKGGSSDPRGYFIRSSLDGFTSDLFSTALPTGAAAAPASNTIALANAFAGLSNVTFRFYVYTPGPDYSVDFKNVSFNNVAAVPEAATWAMMIVGFGMVGFSLRRRVRQSEEAFNEKIKRMTAGEIA